jgi:hypothetical protein
MSNPPDEDCCAPLYWREVPNHRSYHSFLWHLQAFPEQGSVITADGLSHLERACTYCGGCHHVYEHYHEGWQSGKRAYLSRQRDPGVVSNNRRKEGFQLFLLSSTDDVGHNCSRHRTAHQDHHRRQIAVRFLRCVGLLLSSTTDCTRCGAKMAK